MDLWKYYQDKIEPNEYYYKIHNLTEAVKEDWNIFSGGGETQDYRFYAILFLQA